MSHNLIQSYNYSASDFVNTSALDNDKLFLGVSFEN